MDLAKYEELTGTTVPAGDVGRVTATINRVNAQLESLLGYPLDPAENLDITELGKVQYQVLYPYYPYYPIDPDNLLPPDVAEGVFRLFPYNEDDIYVKTDPFTNVYHVKLVQAVNDDEFITIIDLNDYTIKRLKKFGKYIQEQFGWFRWNWYSWLVGNLGKDNGMLIAVDGDWADGTNLPNDLLYLWADMVTYYSSEDVSVTGNIKSESVNGHSWSKTNAGGGKGEDLSPERSASGLKTLAQYAGPNGTLANRVRVL